MKKIELVAAVAAKTGLTKKDAEAAINATFEALAESLAKGEKTQVAGFGTFSVKAREARTARNPRTGETMQVAATKLPAFKAAQALKDAVAK